MDASFFLQITNIIYKLISDWGEQIIPSSGGTRTAHFCGITTYFYEDGTTKENTTCWDEIYTFNPNQTVEEQRFDKQQTFYDQLDKFTYIQLPSEGGKQLIGTYYEIYPPSTSATVAAEATSYTFNWSGITVSAWSDGTFTSAVTYTERKTITFSENTSTTQDKYYTGNYTYNGVNGTYNITQLKKGGQPEPPTPTGYTKDVLVGDRCYNELPEGTEIVDEKVITAVTFDIVPLYTSEIVSWDTTSYTFDWSGITINHYSDGSTTSSVTHISQETVTFDVNTSQVYTKVNQGNFYYNDVRGTYVITQNKKPYTPTYTKRVYVDDRCYSDLPPNTIINDTPQPTPTPTVTATTYDVNPSSKSATVEWDATSYSIQYSGITIEHYSDGTSTSAVTKTGTKYYTYPENTSPTTTEIRAFHFTYGDTDFVYKVRQLEKGEPLPGEATETKAYFLDGSVESYMLDDIPQQWMKNNTALTKVEIGTSCRSVNIDAINGCPNLTSVTIPDSVFSFHISSFGANENLQYINLPKYLTDIPNNCFNGCSSITSITIPSTVKSIGYWGFGNCTSLNYIAFDGTYSQWKKVTKYDYWHKDVPASVIHCSDGDYAF